MSDIKFGKIYRTKEKDSKGDPLDYAVPIEYNAGVLEPGVKYIDICYVETSGVGAISEKRFLQRYELV